MASDGSDGPDGEWAARRARTSSLELARGGKVAALNAAVERARGEILAFADANARWEPDALRPSSSGSARARGRLRLRPGHLHRPAGAENQEGLYWRYEMAVRGLESDLGGVTAGNGAINAVRREAYIPLEPIRGQDISFPFELAKRGWRSVYEPRARASEPMAPTIEGEFRRKRRMMAGAWNTLLRTSMLSPRGYRPLYAFQIYSHRLLRYATPILHLVALATNIALLGEGVVYTITLATQLLVLLAAAALHGHPAAGAADRPLLRRGDRGKRCRPLGPLAPRRAADLGERGGDAMTAAAGAARPGLPRAAELAIAGVALALLSPVLAAAAVAIKLDSRGPVLYRSAPGGKGGEPFELLKLRTMHRDSDPVGVGTPVLEGDPRVTRVGAVLRRFSLDELPNLVNVLRGELAIVGPRPTLEAQVEPYTPHQRRRLEVRPGITGWAQVNGRAGIPWEERIELDVWYVENRSARLDLRILARTARLLVTGHGLYG